MLAKVLLINLDTPSLAKGIINCSNSLSQINAFAVTIANVTTVRDMEKVTARERDAPETRTRLPCLAFNLYNLLALSFPK